MRTPAHSPADALAACERVYGRRGERPAPIDASNRNLARTYLTACGFSSAYARALSVANLNAIWADTTGDLTRQHRANASAGGKPIPQPDADAHDAHDAHDEPDEPDEPDAHDEPDEPDAHDAQPQQQQETPMQNGHDAAPNADGAIQQLQAALVALMASTKAPLDADAIRAIVSEEIQRATIPSECRIVVNETPRGNLPALRHNQAETLLTVVAQGIPAYLAGPAGSGKTTAAEQVAAALNLPFRMQGAASGAHEFLGFVDAHGRYQTTPFRDAFEHGGVFLADEIDGSDPAALLVINAALANGHMAFPDAPTPVARHADFRFIAAANTFGNGADRQYVGRSQLDAATLDRFAFLDWQYDPKLERGLTDNPDWCAYVQRVRDAVAALKLRHVVSPRATIYGAKLLAAGVPRNHVETMLLWRGLTTAEASSIRAALKD